MKKTVFVIAVATLIAGLLTGCGGGAAVSAPTEKVTAGGEGVQALDEILAGTWDAYAGFEQSGELVYVSSDGVVFSFVFNTQNGFTGIYRSGDGYIDASFAGTYDYSDSQMADKDPYNWYYYAKIDKSSIADSGDSTLIGRLGGEDGLNLVFKFRELNGERLLYEETQRVYFKKHL